jgi:hypothetical protein
MRGLFVDGIANDASKLSWVEIPEERPSFIEIVDELKLLLEPEPQDQLREPDHKPPLVIANYKSKGKSDVDNNNNNGDSGVDNSDNSGVPHDVIIADSPRSAAVPLSSSSSTSLIN